MLRTFTAALIATTLVAGSAFAAQPATNGAAPAAAPASNAQSAPKPAASGKQTAAKPANTVKPVKTAKHVRKPVRHHTAHAVKSGTVKTMKS